MLRHFGTAVAGGGLVGLAAVASCAVPGFELVDGGTGGAPTVTSSATGGSSVSGMGGMACQHATYPPKPSATDPGGTDVEVVAAVRTIDFGEDGVQDGIASPIGFDLDGKCTCEGDGHSCVLPSYAEDRCDSEGGRDNGSAFLFWAAKQQGAGISSEDLSASAESGSWTLIVRITEWNGLANDEQVTLALHPSPGFTEDPCNDDGTFPAWGNTDRWPIDSESLSAAGSGGGGGGGGGGVGVGGGPQSCLEPGSPGWDIDQPRFVDTQAYVADFNVVANLPEAGLLLTTSESHLPLVLRAGFVSARLTQEGTGTKWGLVDGVLAGRWKAHDILVAFPRSQEPPLCTDDFAYALVKQVVCQNVDIYSGVPGPTTECDSLSLGMSFTAAPAKIGAVWQAAPNPSLCDPDTDPAFDSCGRD